MSAIGDYVHYSARAYEKYGINRKGEGSYQKWYSQKKAILARANEFTKSTIPINIRKKMESLIGSIMKRNGATSSATKATQGQIEKIIMRQYQKASANINWQGGGVFTGASHDVSYDFRYNLEKIVRQINQLENKVGMLINKSTGTTQQELKIFLEQIEQNHKQLLQLMRQGATTMGVELNITQTDMTSIISQINEVLDKYLALPPVENQQGAIFEQAIGMLPEIARGTALSTANMHISNATYDRERVSINTQHFIKNLSKTIGNMWVNTHGTTVEGKVDVKMTWNNQISNISAKSYNLAKNPYVKISSGSNLIYMLQDVNPDFTNHFLNLFATHDDEAGGSLMVRRKEMFEEIKFLTFYKAISGDNYGRQTADTFVINDVSGTNGVRVYSIHDIINTILRQNLINYIKITSSDGGVWSNENQLQFENHWIGQLGTPDFRKGLVRIAKLIMDVHHHKLTFAFNAKQILPLVK